MISKVQRGPRNPPSMGSSVAEWLSYVSSVSNTPLASPGDISPPPQPLSPRSKSEGESSSTYTRRRNKSISSGYKHEHDSEAIFGLPSFKVDVVTDHDQPVRVYHNLPRFVLQRALGKSKFNAIKWLSKACLFKVIQPDKKGPCTQVVKFVPSPDSVTHDIRNIGNLQGFVVKTDRYLKAFILLAFKNFCKCNCVVFLSGANCQLSKTGAHCWRHGTEFNW